MTRIIHIQVLPDHRVALIFDDGMEGEVDLSKWLDRGVFQRLKDPAEFAKASIGEFGELRWGEDLDLDPDNLRAVVTRYTHRA